MCRIYVRLILLALALGVPAHGQIIMGHDALHSIFTWYQGYEISAATSCATETGVPAADVAIAGANLVCNYAGAYKTAGDYAMDTSAASGVSTLHNFDLYLADFASAPIIYVEFDWSILATGGVGIKHDIQATEGGVPTYPILATNEGIFLGSYWTVLYLYCDGNTPASSAILAGMLPKGPWRIQLDWTQADNSVQDVRAYLQGNPTPFYTNQCINSGTAPGYDGSTAIDGWLQGLVNTPNTQNRVIDHFTVSTAAIDTGF